MSGISTSTALLISAGVGLAGTAASLGYEASQGSPTAPTDTASKEAEAANASAHAQAQALQKRRGLAATTLTSPMGAMGSANIAKATLG